MSEEISSTSKGAWGKVINTKNMFEYILYIALVALIIITSLTNHDFLTISNIVTILISISQMAIIAVGMTMLIIMGQIDLSVGAVAALASVLVSSFVKDGIPFVFSIILTLAICAVVGFANGFIAAKMKIHAMLVTLAMTSVVSGIAYKITGGYTIGALPQSMMVLGQGYFIGVPLQVWVMAVIFVLGWYVLNKTPFGRYNYAIGGNTEAARLSGINVDFIKISVFIIISALAGISGIILTSRLMAGSPDIGSGWEMNVIAATIIGGTSLFGGEGKITGTLVGVLFIGVLDNAMVLWNLSPYTQMIVSGSVILAAVVLSNLKNRKSFS